MLNDAADPPQPGAMRLTGLVDDGLETLTQTEPSVVGTVVSGPEPAPLCHTHTGSFWREAGQRSPPLPNTFSPVESITTVTGLSAFQRVARMWSVSSAEAPLPVWSATMPYKANVARRHQIPRPKRRVLNWAESDAALRQRGSLIVWVCEEAIDGWKATPRSTPGGPPAYSDVAITMALMLRAAFRLALRQTEGGIGSVLRLLGLDWKPVLGPALRFHTGAAQATEVAIGVAGLNRMLNVGRPNSVRIAGSAVGLG